MQSKIFLIYVFTIIIANILLLLLANKMNYIFQAEGSPNTILQKFDNVMGASDEKEHVVGREIIPEYYMQP